MLSDLGIPHKRDAYPSSLSGGMKRKVWTVIPNTKISNAKIHICIMEFKTRF